MSVLRVPMDRLSLICECLEIARALADEKHRASMDAGKFDPALYAALSKCEEAQIVFRVYVTDKLPVVELEAV